MCDSADEMIRVSLVAKSERFDPNDERWVAQENDLYDDLRRSVRGFAVQSRAVPGTRGAIEAIVIALGSAGAFTAFVECLKAWLSRDKSRCVVITVSHSEGEERIVIEGSSIDAASFHHLAEVVGKRLGGE